MSGLPLELQKSVNALYLLDVRDAIDTIKVQWPGIHLEPPLALASVGAPLPFSELGFLAPFNNEIFDEQVKNENMEYTCGINIFWTNCLGSVTPYVPISKARVLEFAANTTTGQLKNTLVAHASFHTADSMPIGDVVDLSPEELKHAVLFKVAQRIKENAPESELVEWRRTLLSAPCTFKRVDTAQGRYAAAQNARLKILSSGFLVRQTARQLAANIWGFKQAQQKLHGDTYGSKAIAKFYTDHVDKAAGTEQMHKEGTVDACLTIYDRFFSIPECDEIVEYFDNLYGPDSAFNNIWKLQEIVSRCRTPKKIIQFTRLLNDWLLGGKISNKEVTINILKPGTRNSVMDVAMHQCQCPLQCNHLN